MGQPGEFPLHVLDGPVDFDHNHFAGFWIRRDLRVKCPMGLKSQVGVLFFPSRREEPARKTASYARRPGTSNAPSGARPSTGLRTL